MRSRSQGWPCVLAQSQSALLTRKESRLYAAAPEEQTLPKPLLSTAPQLQGAATVQPSRLFDPRRASRLHSPVDTTGKWEVWGWPVGQFAVVESYEIPQKLRTTNAGWSVEKCETWR